MTVPEYDAQGLVIKAMETRKEYSNTYVRVRTYEYKNGNVISSRTVERDKITTSQYDYYLDKENKLSEYLIQSYYTFGSGTPPKNMLKSIKTTAYSSILVGSYAYVFTGQGYVHQQTTKWESDGNMVGNSESINTYKCNWSELSRTRRLSFNPLGNYFLQRFCRSAAGLKASLSFFS